MTSRTEMYSVQTTSGFVPTCAGPRLQVEYNTGAQEQLLRVKFPDWLPRSGAHLRRIGRIMVCLEGPGAGALVTWEGLTACGLTESH